MRILCLIPALGAGGAERVMSYLVEYWARRHQVALLTWETAGAQPFFPIPESVTLIQTDKLGSRRLNWIARVLSRPGAIRRTVNDFGPNVVVSFMDTMNVTALLGCVGLVVPIIVAERTDPVLGIDRARRSLRDATYRLADAVVVQTRRVNGYFPQSLRSRIRIIGNPVPPAKQMANPDRAGPDGRFRVISIGRLAPQKAYDRLIAAFSKVAHRHPMWDLLIIGEGPDRASLEAQIRETGLAKRIALPGRTTDIAEALASAHLIGWSSMYEGFPNALAEGLAAGLPAVGYAGVSGVEDLIIEGVTGLLVDPAKDEDGFAEALSRLMGNVPMRVRMGESACRHVAHWAPEHVFRQWDELLADAVGARSSAA